VVGGSFGGSVELSAGSIKTCPARKNTVSVFLNFTKTDMSVHMNLCNYFFRIHSIVLISTTCSLLALYFMHEIRETSDVRFMPEISLDKCLTIYSMDISQ